MGAVEPHYATDNVTLIDTIKNKKIKYFYFQCMDVLEITEPSYEEVAECQVRNLNLFFDREIARVFFPK